MLSLRGRRCPEDESVIAADEEGTEPKNAGAALPEKFEFIATLRHLSRVVFKSVQSKVDQDVECSCRKYRDTFALGRIVNQTIDTGKNSGGLGQDMFQVAPK
jgi:hypothetical protein